MEPNYLTGLIRILVLLKNDYAPQAGLEPATLRLTAERTAIVLLGNKDTGCPLEALNS